MGTITKRGKSYRIRVYTGYNLDGKQIEKTMTWTPPSGMTERQAEKEAQRQAILFEERIKNGETFGGKILFAEFTQLWMQNHAEPNLRPRTVARYAELLRTINNHLGHLALEKITPTHLLNFYAQLRQSTVTSTSYKCPDLKRMLQERKMTKAELSRKSGVSLTTLSTIYTGKAVSAESAKKICSALCLPLDVCFNRASEAKPLSASTIKHHHRLLVNILNAAVQWQYIPYNPANRIATPKAEAPEIDYLDDTQAKRLLQELNSAPGYYRRPITLLLLTGMRRSEILGIEWSDIDWEAKTLRIMRTSQCLPQKGVYTDTTKNKSSKRIVTLSDPAIAVLLEQKQWQLLQKQSLKDKWADSNRVVTSQDGSPMHPDRLTHWFAKFVARNCPDLPPIGLHSLRHTFATLALGAGIPLPAVSRQLGHSNIATTARIYAHVIHRQQLEASSRVSDILADFLLN